MTLAMLAGRLAGISRIILLALLLLQYCASRISILYICMNMNVLLKIVYAVGTRAAIITGDWCIEYIPARRQILQGKPVLERGQ